MKLDYSVSIDWTVSGDNARTTYEFTDASSAEQCLSRIVQDLHEDKLDVKLVQENNETNTTLWHVLEVDNDNNPTDNVLAHLKMTEPL